MGNEVTEEGRVGTCGSYNWIMDLGCTQGAIKNPPVDLR